MTYKLNMLLLQHMQICIAYQLHRGLAVIPKSVNPDRIRDNFKATAVKLDEDDLTKLKALDRNTRFLKFSSFQTKSNEDFWDTATDAAFVI